MAYLPLGVEVAASGLFSVGVAVSDVLLLQENSSVAIVMMARARKLVVFMG
jgi:hypothetical protein